MKHAPIRHCERSEAIQSKWMAMSRVAVLTVAFLVFSFPAYACSEMSSLASQLDVSEIVFEGHVERLERVEVVNPKNKEERADIIVNVYRVDQGWKGTEKGQEFYVSPQYGYPRNFKGQLPPVKDAPQVIMTLSMPWGKSGENIIYITACPESHPVTSTNKLLLSSRFPSAALQ